MIIIINALYVLAVTIIIYIAYKYLIQKKEFWPDGAWGILTIVVALILAIVVIPRWPPPPPPINTPTPLPQAAPIDTSLPSTMPLAIPTGNLLFSDNFDDGFAHGFNFYQGDWKVVDDGSGNKVLQGNPSNGSSNGSFGLSNFRDGVVEFRFKVISADYQVQHHVAEFGFRNQSVINGNWTEYILVYDPESPPSLSLNYQEKSNLWQPVEAISGGGSIQSGEGKWINLRVEIQGKNIKVFVDGNPFITALDSRDGQGGFFLGALGNVVVQFDDFKVWDLSK